MAKDSAAGIEMGRSFHQEGTVNEKVCESETLLLIHVENCFKLLQYVVAFYRFVL